MTIRRRDLLALAGLLGAGSVLGPTGAVRAGMTTPPYRGPMKLDGAPKKTSVLVLGAGLAGLTAAYELRNAGYQVQLLEYNNRIGGRSWTLRGGDVYTELGGEKQICEFAPGVYMNPGPWRISHTHKAILDYCKRFGVALEPFVQLNYAGYVHSRNVLGGKPQRYAHVAADFQGYLAEMMTAALSKGGLDQPLAPEHLALLKPMLASWGGLDGSGRYVTGASSSRLRGPESISFEDASITYSQLLKFADVLQLGEDAAMWRGANHPGLASFQTTLFQPVGGMDMIPKAFASRLPGVIRTNARVLSMTQDESRVTVTYEDVSRPGSSLQASANWCICTIPLSILGQLELRIGAPMKAAIDAISYSSETKIGLQFRRRFWEEDEGIFGGFSITDLPIRQIFYPSGGLNTPGPGLLYGAVLHRGPPTYEFTGMTPAERVRRAVEYGAQIHPQYHKEFQNGMAVAWHRNPYTMGCNAQWTPDLIRKHHANARAIDGRFVLAGEGVSGHGWQDGAIMSALEVVERLHRRIVAAVR
ncbi:flavin monoamine oxidase family protein [Peristeroidobacter soli]|jgi:monoamine oxidase|uniref:flavin monoamine oxidase family protein n=1 Tax=Peristeroidobacter soli TaxID=2497877 RepID=UPI001FECBD93|nr:flavin monoamine oxidase family protein [Peristeroidobacter soli]